MPKAVKMYLTHITVICPNVPWDMMRYDQAVPATEDNSYKLVRLARGSSDPADHVVDFITHKRTPSGPNIERWASFGCKITNQYSIE
jgi:hypothetical protein